MSAGHGTRHETFMYNQFTVFGPTDDSAAVHGKDPVEKPGFSHLANHLF